MSRTDFSQSILNEVIVNHFSAVVEEMSSIIMRTAHTVFIKETLDYSGALVTPEGEMFAYPRSCVPSNCGTPLGPGVRAFETWRPGDVCITNDPYTTSGMVTHLPDIFLLKPIFAGDELICFAWTFIHASDVGGGVPGSMATATTEIYEEGLRIRPSLLYREGVFNDELWNVIADNCRIPERNLGDINALLAAMDRAEKRIHQIVAKYGAKAVRDTARYTLDRSEARARAVLATIPAGAYNFVDYLDDDFISDDPIRLELTLRSDGGGAIELDFTGTDPQVAASLNLPACGQPHHPLLSFALSNYVITQDEGVRLNAGILRCVRLVLPPHSVVNPAFPAPCGNRYLTSMRIFDATLGALGKAMPGRIPVAGASQNGLTIISSPPREDEEASIAIANPVQGGSGAMPGLDGISGVDLAISFLRNVPTEVLEQEAPVRVHRFGFVADSEGPGEWRGGSAVEYILEFTDPEARIVMRGKERYRFEPWGAAGGGCGSRGSTGTRSADGTETSIGKQLVYRPRDGEILVQRGIGGGGLGPATRRDPALVLEDVRDGHVSPDRARDVYGVAIVDDAVDAAATEALRRAAPPATSFDFGPARLAFENSYGDRLQLIRDRLLTIPPEARKSTRDRLIGAMRAGATIEDLRALPIPAGSRATGGAR